MMFELADPLRKVMAAIFGLASIALSSQLLNGLFFDLSHALTIGIAAVGATAVAVVLYRLGLEGAAVVFGHIVAFVALFGAVYFASDGLPFGPVRSVWNGIIGWSDLLRAPVPTESTPALMMPLVFSGWVCAALVVELALRSKRSVMGILPMALLFGGFALVAAASAPRTVLILAQGAVLLAFVWATGSSDLVSSFSDGAARFRSALAPLAVGVVALGGAWLVSGVFVGEDRYDPRASIAAPVQIDSTVSPLTLLKSDLVNGSAEELFRVEFLTDPPAAGDLFVRSVALDLFDGVLWRAADTFSAAGAQLIEAEETGSPLSQYRIVTSEEYDRSYLPVIGDPSRIAGDTSNIGFSPALDSLATAEGSEALAYRVSAFVSSPLEGPQDGEVLVDGEADQFLQLPAEGLPSSALGLLDRLTEAPGSLARVNELRELLVDTQFSYSVEAPTGHGIAALEFYTGGRTRSDGFPGFVGYAEQAASLFVNLARADGLPARLAVGYRLEVADDETIDAASAIYVASELDAWAWAEVKVAGGTWVPIDVTPTTESDVDPPSAPVLSLPDEAAVQSAPIIQPEVLETADGSADAALGSSRSFWPALVVLLVVAAVLTPFFLKRRRRRRRLGEQESPNAVLGRWTEARDLLRDVGVPIGRSFTPKEVVAMAQAEGVLPVDSAGESLAQLADSALYEPDILDETQVGVASELERLVRGEVRNGVGRRQRLVGRFGTKSLRGLSDLRAELPPAFSDVRLGGMPEAQDLPASEPDDLVIDLTDDSFTEGREDRELVSATTEEWK